MATKRTLKDLKTFTFRDANNKELNLGDFLEKDDFYEKTKGKAKTVVGVFVKHTAIQRLAVTAGIQMQQPTMLVTPNGSNEQQHLFTATFIGGDNPLPTVEIGEASTRNTSNGVSRNYMGTMGFKRLFDRGVLAHLGFIELYSQEEADDLNEEHINTKISSKELEAIGPYVNGIVNAATVKDLDEAMSKAIADRKAGKIEISNPQRSYLRNIYQTNRFNLELAADDLSSSPVKQVKRVEAPTEPVEAPDAPESPIAAKVREANAKLEAKAQEAEKGETAEEHAAKVASGEIPF
jgi:hypothetical protein